MNGKDQTEDSKTVNTKEAENENKKEIENCKNGEIKNAFNVKIQKEKVTAITLEWNSIKAAEVYKVEKYHKLRGWKKVDWTGKCISNIENLDENFGFRLRVKALKFCEEEQEYKEFLTSEEIVACTLSREPSTICLYRAIKKDQQFLVKRILRRRPNLIEFPAANGYLPLANAIAHCDMSIVDVLLSAGADVSVGNTYNKRTPLHQAFFYGRLPVARMLLNKKASMEAKDIYGLTACHLAIDANQGEILKFALENGANTEARDDCGWTLLMRAVVMETDLEILKLLIDHQADLNAKDLLDLTCKDLARLYNNQIANEYMAEVVKLKETAQTEETNEVKI